jgi:hypothetical protein
MELAAANLDGNATYKLMLVIKRIRSRVDTCTQYSGSQRIRRPQQK